MLTPIGPGRYSAISAATSSNEFGASALRSWRIGGDSSWNTPIVSPRDSRANVVASSSEMSSMRNSGSRVGPDHRHRVGDHVEVAQPEEVHLQQPEVFDAVHLVLGDDGRVGRFLAGLGLALDRDVVGDAGPW